MTNSDTRPETAQRLQAAREASGFPSAKAAARRFGWSEDTYAQHENGTRGLTRSATRYAKAFKVSSAWILTGEGDGPGESSEIISELRAIVLALRNDDERRELLQMVRRYKLGIDAEARERLSGEGEGHAGGGYEK
ncbi:helix-turn-helix domain-containing protein [Amaricoccus solimangrovi]|uniref:Helix-turn-helix transcriptional regulator n=1 Tax=Amaricoccus solimangrovi TaxID=2589815 RepID=A0A501WKS6_9RHOB|nr:helix-turn-helix transcriptional regulator [Amaricoccus solimangrovi]TPE49958.1 helix-turn-helix transcriptional regulator [Amaricoccus solimangrovi]